MNSAEELLAKIKSVKHSNRSVRDKIVLIIFLRKLLKEAIKC